MRERGDGGTIVATACMSESGRLRCWGFQKVFRTTLYVSYDVDTYTYTSLSLYMYTYVAIYVCVYIYEYYYHGDIL